MPAISAYSANATAKIRDNPS